MSYAIVRNEKLTRDQAKGIYIHNNRKAKNHSNKDIDISKSEQNYYLKKNELSYIKEFDKLKEQYDLKGQIKSTSIIMCEMIFTSDKEFFENIGPEETKRYFEESYNFICNYKKLGDKNIISAVIHYDETTPHMHLIYIPVVHTKDKSGNEIDKVCARDFWKGRDSYRKLQDSFYNYITSKGFDLQRGLPAEETNRKYETVQDYKQITNFEETKKVLEDINLGLPETPDIKDLKKVMIGRDEKIEQEIIKPRDNLIQQLYEEIKALHKQLSKQANTVEFATKFENKYSSLKNSNAILEQTLADKDKEFELKMENTLFNVEQKYKSRIKELEKENRLLNKMIDKFKVNIKKFIKWICNKFSYSSQDDLIRDFEKETYTNFNIDKSLDINKFKKKYNNFEKN